MGATKFNIDSSLDENEFKTLCNAKTNNNNVIQLFDRQIGENLLTKEILAEKLCYSVSNINKLMKQEKIPYFKNGRSVRFKYSDVVAALKKGSAA